MLTDLGFTSYLGGGNQFIFTWLWLALLLTLVMAMPNTQQIMNRFEPAMQLHPADEQNEIRLMARLHATLGWRPNGGWAVATGVTAVLGIFAMSRISEFLYFQF